MQSGSVTCPQCQYEQVIDKGIQYLPLDATAIADIIPLDGTNLTFCSRCHDEVPSYSWCGACSVTLCEFHHQDHKLSINTSRHEVMTFKDITHSHVVIEPRMPPISCPQELEQDATLFCEECSYMVSPKAMMSADHKSHNYCEADSLIDKSVASIEESMVVLEDRERGLVNAMETISNTVTKVKEEMANSMKDVEIIFAKIHQDLEQREHALLQRLHDISTRKTTILNDQLQEMEDALEKCRHALTVSGDLLEKSAESVVKGGGVYIVGMSSTIASRSDELDDLIVNIPFEPQVDPFIRASFVKDEIEAIQTVLKSLGSLLTKDNTPVIDNLECRSPRHEEEDDDNDEDEENDLPGSEEVKQGPYGSRRSAGGSKIVDQTGRSTYSAISKEAARPNSKINNIPIKVSFTVRTEDPPTLSTCNKTTYSKEAVVVEARVLPASGPSESSSVSGPCRDTKSIEELYGPVVGEVVVLTEIERQHANPHSVRSNYESFVGDSWNIPIFRLTREIVSTL